MDAYEIYTSWWMDHYGYPCPITREAWERWCKVTAWPRRLSETQADINTERREGWAYDND